MPGDGERLPLSVAIVCKDNVGTLPRTLEGVKGLAAEIVTVDSGSTDGTLELLAAAGARVICSPWLGHVRTKQMALGECSQPWVLCLDSDESPDAELQDAIRQAVSRGGAVDGPAGYELRRVTWYRERPLRFAWQPEWRLRLVRRGAAAWGGIDPHDQLRLIDGSGDSPPSHRDTEVAQRGGEGSEGNGSGIGDALPHGGVSLGRLAGTLRHDSFETFRAHLSKQLAYSRLSAEGLHARGARTNAMRMALAPAGALLKQLVLKQAWRDGVPGWLAAGTTAAGALMKHMILLELEHAARDGAGPKHAPRTGETGSAGGA